MPRYFFHVVDGEFIPDLNGMECATFEKAKDEAVRVAGAKLKDQGLKLWRTGRFDMFVCHEQNKTRLRLSFQAVDLNDQ